MNLSTKINILIICIVLITGTVVGSLAIETTNDSFQVFAEDLWEYKLNDWEGYYTEFYQHNGYSWDGVDRRQSSVSNGVGYLERIGEEERNLILTDANGMILLHPDYHMVGTKVSMGVLHYGRELVVDGDVVGIVFPEMYFNSRFWYLEQKFSSEMCRAIVKGILLTCIFGMLLGLALSRSLVIPLKELILGTSQMAKGNFDGHLPVYSDDEMGELARSFNTMAEEVESAAALRRQMFADISHELKTPLTVLATKLEGSLERNRPMETVEVSALYDEVIRLNNMVNELQDLSRLELGKANLNKTLVDFKSFFEELLILMQAEAEARKIVLEVNFAEELPYCYADPARLKQIVFNLVNNALRYTKEGGHVWLQAFEKRDQFVIVVKDDGIGIGPEDLPYIFQRFYRADKSRERSSGGSGLGLAITQELVQAHGGTITVESKEGVGSTFTVQLPLFHEE